LLVGNPASRGQPLSFLASLGYTCEETDDPYSALVQLCQRPLVFHAVILSLASLYREELQVITAIKRRLPHLDVWLAQTDGRHSAMVEAIRLGADGLLSEDGLHRIGMPVAPEPASTTGPDGTGPHEDEDASTGASGVDSNLQHDPLGHEMEVTVGEPVLSADELRALLQEQPYPPRGDE
jgi:hypothetical protein